MDSLTFVITSVNIILVTFSEDFEKVASSILCVCHLFCCFVCCCFFPFFFLSFSARLILSYAVCFCSIKHCV